MWRTDGCLAASVTVGVLNDLGEAAIVRRLCGKLCHLSIFIGCDGDHNSHDPALFHDVTKI